MRRAEDIDFASSVPEDYLEKLSKDIPKVILPLVSDCVRAFLAHIEAPEEEIERISEKIYQRRLNEMFHMVDGYSVKKTRELLRKELINEAHTKKIKAAEKLLKRGVLMEYIAEDMDLTPEDIAILKKE